MQLSRMMPRYLKVELEYPEGHDCRDARQAAADTKAEIDEDCGSSERQAVYDYIRYEANQDSERVQEFRELIDPNEGDEAYPQYPSNSL